MHITVMNVTPTELSSRRYERNASAIVLRDPPLSSGMQGAIYDVVQVDGRPVTGLLAKVFKQHLPQNLVEIVDVVRTHKEKIREVSSLQALPLFLFAGTSGGKRADGYLMKRASGKRFDSIVEEDLNKYINLPIEDRLGFCLQFTQGMDELYNMTIVHADLNYQNLMIDLQLKALTIIDLDGGAVSRGGSVPITIGKAEPGWLDPQIIAQKAAGSRRIVVDMRADEWAVACGVHYLLFGVAPYFLIQRHPEIRSYLRQYRWPQVRGVAGIGLQNQSVFDYYERGYAKVPLLHDSFERSFNDGFLDASRRMSAYHWRQKLKAQLAAIQATPKPPASLAPTSGGGKQGIGHAKVTTTVSKGLGKTKIARPAPARTVSSTGTAGSAFKQSRMPTAPAKATTQSPPATQVAPVRRIPVPMLTVAGVVILATVLLGTTLVVRNLSSRPVAGNDPGIRLLMEHLVVESDPAPANVYLASTGRWIGQTPLTSALLPGPYTLRIAKQGYLTKTTTVRVQSGEGGRVSVALTPTPMSVSLDSVPAGAQVSIDGVSVGRTPYTGQIAKPGSHRIRVVYQGMVWSRQIDFSPGASVKYTATFKRQEPKQKPPVVPPPPPPVIPAPPAIPVIPPPP